ncbi:MAG: YdcF family protein [Pseudomonadota bacterium]
MTLGIKGLKWRWVAIVLLVALALDYNGFRHRAAETSLGNLDGVEGVTALTGGSGIRIAAALELLENGAGKRLLISGVNPSISRDEVAARAGGSNTLYDCCVDIGYEATTTEENADEVSAWANAHGFVRIALVTSDYHLPRAKLLLSARAPELELVEVPVRTRIDPSRAYSDWRSFRGTVTEWLKWRVTQAMTVLN